MRRKGKKDESLDGGMNTTGLIGQWTMDGAGGDLDDHLAPSAEPLIAPTDRPTASGTAYVIPILVKDPDDENWRPLAGSEDAAAEASELADRLLRY